MSEVKRYDAVHLRYDENNIRYADGCEVEVVTASDYDALRAENESLRGNCKRMGADAKQQARLLKKLERELAALKAAPAADSTLRHSVARNQQAEREAFDAWWQADEQAELRRLCVKGWGEFIWNAALSAPAVGQPTLTVWEGAMPESNGKSNFTAVLMRKGADLLDGIAGGMTIARSEYPDRVRYEADCIRWMIGELADEPCIIDYDADKHSGYVAPAAAGQDVSGLVATLKKCEPYLSEKVHYTCEEAGDYRVFRLELYISTPAKAPEPFEVAAERWIRESLAAHKAGEVKP